MSATDSTDRELIPRYEVLQAALPEDLVNLVTSAIDKGWIPQGGVCAAPEGLFQAMTSTTARLRKFAALRD